MNRGECFPEGQAWLEKPGMRGVRACHVVHSGSSSVKQLAITEEEVNHMHNLGINRGITPVKPEYGLTLDGDVPGGNAGILEQVRAFTALDNLPLFKEVGVPLIVNRLYLEVT